MLDLLINPYFWLSLSLFCLVVEIFTTGFFFAVFSLGALVSALGVLFIKNGFQLSLVFCFSSLIFFIALKPWYTKIVLQKGQKRSFGFEALCGQIAVVTKKITPEQMGYVKVDGDEWQALADSSIEIDEKVIIVKTEANRVWVSKNEV